MRPQIDFYGNDEQFDENNIDYLRLAAPEIMGAKLAGELTPEQVNQYNKSKFTKKDFVSKLLGIFKGNSAT